MTLSTASFGPRVVAVLAAWLGAACAPIDIGELPAATPTVRVLRATVTDGDRSRGLASTSPGCPLEVVFDLRNEAALPIGLASPRLVATGAPLETMSLTLEPASALAAGGTARARVRFGAGEMAGPPSRTTVRFQADPQVAADGGVDGGSVELVSERAAVLELATSGGRIVVFSLVPSTTHVRPGDSPVDVRARVFYRPAPGGPLRLEGLTAELRLDHGDGWTVTADPNNPTTLMACGHPEPGGCAGAGGELRFSLGVPASAPTGSVSFGLRVQGVEAASGTAPAVGVCSGPPVAIRIDVGP